MVWTNTCSNHVLQARVPSVGGDIWSALMDHTSFDNISPHLDLLHPQL